MKSDKWWLTKEQKEKDIKKGIIRDEDGKPIRDGTIESPPIRKRDIDKAYKYDINYVKKPSFDSLSAIRDRNKSGPTIKENQEAAKKRREQFRLEDKLKRGESNE